MSLFISFFIFVDYASFPFVFIPPAQRKCWGGGRISASLRPFVRPASRVRSVTPTALFGFLSELYILSCKFRRCVACKDSCKMKFGIFQDLLLWLCIVLTSDLVWITSMDNHGAAGVSQNAGVLVVLVIVYDICLYHTGGQRFFLSQP